MDEVWKDELTRRQHYGLWIRPIFRHLIFILEIKYLKNNKIDQHAYRHSAVNSRPSVNKGPCTPCRIHGHLRGFPLFAARDLYLAEHQAAVRTAETEVVFHCRINLQIPGFIRTVIQITLRILVEDIDGGR